MKSKSAIMTAMGAQVIFEAQRMLDANEVPRGEPVVIWIDEAAKLDAVMLAGLGIRGSHDLDILTLDKSEYHTQPDERALMELAVQKLEDKYESARNFPSAARTVVTDRGANYVQREYVGGWVEP